MSCLALSDVGMEETIFLVMKEITNSKWCWGSRLTPWVFRGNKEKTISCL